MPKQMFYNIPVEKQQMFIEAAMEEFTTKSFELVSVNSIIKKANISRGSFYTYFTDLDELFNYIFETVKTERLQYAKHLVKESNGDLFVFVRKLFLYDFDNFQSKHRYSLFRNYIYYLQFSNHGSVKNTIIQSIMDSMQEEGIKIEKVFDFSKYSISLEDLPDVVEMLMLIIINTFLKSESGEYSQEEVINLFDKRLNIFQNGLLKR